MNVFKKIFCCITLLAFTNTLCVAKNNSYVLRTNNCTDESTNNFIQNTKSNQKKESKDCAKNHFFEQKHAFELESSASMRIETVIFVQLLERFHFLHKKIKEFSSEEILRSYAEILDKNKSVLTQDDVNKFICTFKTTLNWLWHNGSLTPGFYLVNIWRKEYLDRLKWVDKMLNNSFDLKSKKIINIERKKANFAKNKHELDELWTDKLHNELINEMLIINHQNNSNDFNDEDSDNVNFNDISEKEALANRVKAKKALKMKYANLAKLIKNLDAVDVQEMYCNNLGQFYDPHTSFMSADTLEDFAISIRNSLFGIGAILKDVDGSCIISEIMPGGPAEKSGKLKVGDKILSVAQDKNDFESIEGLQLRKSVKLIRGAKGSNVRLLIQSVDNPSNRKIVDLVRDEIKLNDNLAFAKLFLVRDFYNKYHRIGWIDAPSFYGECNDKDKARSLSDDVKELILRLKSFKIEGLVLDLRKNGGGLLNEAIKLVGLFLNNCPVVSVSCEENSRKMMYAGSNKCVYDCPLMILTSRFSASAAEIVTGALQNTKRALIFGTNTTYGKGSVQTLIEMDKLSMVSNFGYKLGGTKLTVQKWYLPNGQSTQRNGVKSDICLPSIYDCLPIMEIDNPHALQNDSVAKMNFNGIENCKSCNFLKSGTIQALVQRQHLRSKSKVFAFNKKYVDFISEKYKQTNYSLNLHNRINDINLTHATRRFLNEEKKHFCKFQYPNFTINLKGIENKESKKSKNKEDFDFWQIEAMSIMADWLSFLKKNDCSLNVWTYINPINSIFK